VEEELRLAFGADLVGVLDRTGALRAGAGRDRTLRLLEAGDGRRTVVERVVLRVVGRALEVERDVAVDLLVTGVARRVVGRALEVERDVGVDLLVTGVARRAVGFDLGVARDVGVDLLVTGVARRAVGVWRPV
jgi:hypothetical protein